MGYTEAQILCRISTALNDPSTALWGTAEIRAHLDQSLRELSDYSPNYAKGTVSFASTAKKLVLSALSNLIEVEDIEYEIDLDPPRKRNFQVRGGTAIIDISFWPSAGDEAYVYYKTFHSISGTATNTLNPTEERLLIDLTAGQAMVSKAATVYAQTHSAISAIAQAGTAIGLIAAQLGSATLDIASGRTEAAKMAALALSAGTAIGSMTADLGSALANLNSGQSLINTVPVGAGAPEYMSQAVSLIGLSRGDLSQAQGYLQQASSGGGANSSFINLASADINVASGRINEAAINLRKVSSQLSIASSGRVLEAWGKSKEAKALAELRAMSQPKMYVRWPTVK